MASTFFGLYIGQSGLTAYQAAVNTTANNIANVQTEGYTRQEVIREEAASIRCHTQYGTLGSGVSATAIEQIRDLYYDVKYWNNNSKLNEYTTKDYYLSQIETYFTDSDSVAGFSTIFSNMYTALETLNSQASEIDARQSYVGTTESLTTYFHSTAENLQSLQEEVNSVIYTKVEEINTIAQKIAATTKQINIIEQNGQNANDLRDERALLIDELSEIVPVEVEENTVNELTGGTTYTVKINGLTLVDTFDYNQLTCVERENKVNQSDAEGLYDIYWLDISGEVSQNKLDCTSSSMTGSLRSLFEIRDGNNSENFSGTMNSYQTYYYTDASGNEARGTAVTVTGTTSEAIDSTEDIQEIIQQMNLADQGIISLNNQDYNYQGFDVQYDSTTGQLTYTFYLEDTLTLSEATAAIGSSAEVGEAIDYMGIPYYLSQLNGFMRAYAEAYNDIQESGQDLYGNAGEAYYVATDDQGNEYDFDQAYVSGSGYVMSTMTDGSLYYKDAAGNITSEYASGAYDTYYFLTADSVEVNEDIIADGGLIAAATDVTDGTEASDLIDKYYSLCTEEVLYRNTTADSFLQCIISDISVDTQAAEIFETSYTNVVDSIVSQRTSVSGVDEDEEALDLVKFQNAYNLSSKMIQTLSEMYDRLITETGV